MTKEARSWHRRRQKNHQKNASEEFVKIVTRKEVNMRSSNLRRTKSQEVENFTEE